MARPIEFDRANARAAALELFWRQGYTATSMAQLLEAMAIGQSSFYAAFGGKREVFQECLETFYLRTRRALEVVMEEQHGPTAIAQFFYNTMIDVPAKDRLSGCMMVNTVLELSGVDDELSKLASQYLKEIQALFEICLSSSDPSGEKATKNIACRSDAETAAAWMITNYGLRVASRSLSRQEMVNMLKSALGDALARQLH